MAEPDDLDGERREPGEAGVYEYVGLDPFEHNQWTVEGEIERAGAFARGSHSVRGWRRGVTVFVAVAFILPIALSALAVMVRLLLALLGW